MAKILQGNALGMAGAVAVVAAVVAGAIYMMQPAPEAPPPPPPAQQAETAPQAPEAAARQTPSIDVVRIEPDGAATVAGRAEAGARVSLRLDGEEAHSAPADTGGAYAALFTLPPSPAARILTVASFGADGVEVLGAEQVILAPTEAAPVAAGEVAPPVALKITESGTEVLQAAPPSADVVGNIIINSITYAGGLVKVGGVGAPESSVRLYLNDAPAGEGPIAQSGAWSLDLAGVEPGIYTLRADQIGADGKVTSRYETPFKREETAALAAAAPLSAETPAAVTVQPGLTLWAIAEATFGAGDMYVQVYEANKDKIRDPDLIFPGQVFDIPKAAP